MASGVSSKRSSTYAYGRALDDKLNERDDLRVILDWLNEATSEWRHIGVQLGLEVHELNMIEKENSQDLKLCFQKVIIEIFRKGDLTWSILLQALESDAVGLKKLAFETKEKLRDANSRVLTDGDIRHTLLNATISYHEPKSPKDGDNHDFINNASPLNKSHTALPDLPAMCHLPLDESYNTGKMTKVRKKEELLDDHPGYHQSITTTEAEKRLQKCDENCCYLTRYSKNNKSYVLSVCQKRPIQGIEHFGIEVQDGKCKIQGKTEEFPNINQLLEHYEQNVIDPSFITIGKKFTREDYSAAFSKTLMREQDSYHGTISNREAEQRLKKYSGDCCYLTCYSKDNKSYMLSVRRKRVIKNILIDVRDGKCNIHDETKVFDDITQMLQYYELNKLDRLRNIGKQFTEDDYDASRNSCIVL